MSRRHLRRVAVALACASAAATATAAPALADETAVGLSTDSPSSLVTFDVNDPGLGADRRHHVPDGRD